MASTIRNKAMNALIEMGVPANLKGFQYIADAMELFEEDKIWMRSGSTILLYEKIAAINQNSASCVERNIRHAFSVALTKGYLERVEKYLTLQNPTNSNLLAVFYIRLSQENKDEED